MLILICKRFRLKTSLPLSRLYINISKEPFNSGSDYILAVKHEVPPFKLLKRTFSMFADLSLSL